MTGEYVHSNVKSVHDYRFIGKPVPRVDGLDIVTGRNIYLEDVPQPKALFGKIKPSPYPHAWIKSINLDKAYAIPGVVKIMTYKDIAPEQKFGIPQHKPVLGQKLCAVGDAVAIIAAETQEAANMASDAIEVEYEVLKPVFDAVEAQQDGAPQLYPDYLDHNVVPGGFPIFQPDGLWWHLEKGNTEEGFKDCAFVAGGEVRFDKKPVPGAPECPGVVVTYLGGREFRTEVTSDALRCHKTACEGNIPGSHIEAKAYAVGGSYGNKTVMKTITTYGMLLAKATNRPVSILMSKAEQYTMFETRLGSTFQGDIGMDKDGIVRSVKGLWSVDDGQFGNSVQGQISVGLGEAQLGMCKCPNWDLDTRLVVTNKMLAGVVRGYGGQELNSCLTLLMAKTMRAGNFEPLKCLRDNFCREGDRYFWRDGREWTAYSINYDECCDKAAEKFRWYDRWKGWNVPTYVSEDGRYRRGLGVSVTGNADCGEAFAEAYCRMVPDRRNLKHATFTIHADVSEIGNGERTSMTKMAAEIFNVPMEDVTLVPADTMTTPFTEGHGGSRTTRTTGTAVVKACLDLRQKMFDVAAQLTRQGQDSLICNHNGIEPKAKPELWIPFSKCVPDPMTTLTGFGRYSEDFGIPNFFCTMIEVEVDTETGKAYPVEMLGATDCGQIIDPNNAELQVHGAIGSASLDTAFFEEHVLDENLGRQMTYDMINYKWRTFNEFFPVETSFTESKMDTRVFGAVGFGEITGAAAASAAIMAISNAIGKEITTYPATPDVVLRALGKID